ncbi:hypothetical protein SLEP1_g57487 [Rubroshorea leprosula]|uniref:Uncharacterized protein n=1 Tax=Rubroshorea leprosula TaxID=152421 RepID=A0AAV5MPN9_9ROSI|nr:hypothetical protein SLEP1_g57487 [Rubroshorea leprosula]
MYHGYILLVSNLFLTNKNKIKCCRYYVECHDFDSVVMDIPASILLKLLSSVYARTPK